MTRRSFSTLLAAAPMALAQSKPRNIVFILTDDHRYDALGFLKGQSFLRTPHLDSMAKGGVYARNAFVTTALCSPSRASILTGQYAHKHRVVDNNNPVPAGTTFFPQLLQKAGYETAFLGKWHMGGEGDSPQPGFDKWVSFRGQGHYLPHADGLNLDGKPVAQKGYITDEITDYAVDWLKQRDGTKPFFLYLSHKATHSEFIPAERHRGTFENEQFVPPKSMAAAKPEQHQPMWVQNQRNSWHGMDFPYHSDLNIEQYYKRYAETLMAVDDSVGRVFELLRQRKLLDSTLVVYMGDNGFAFGEHGLIDKRTAYEESMRVPMLLHCPELFKAGSVMPEVVANIDIAPTLLQVAGVPVPGGMQGMSFLPLARGEKKPWRDALLYEYFWERNFPQTPTVHAVRGDRYKYIRYQGIWDLDELYDLQQDPFEMNNLIFSESHQPIVKQMNQKLFAMLDSTGGMYIQLNPDKGRQQNIRRSGKSKAADFPSELIK